ncbi:nuclear transport factor 2 family protein [Pedobacter nototheniae]|uniref:nuclear transport factor 2 family protein n=1 Tax=Pedobacter nototheniae TaxID=2488994 RepID=UPI00292DB4C9|nr:nuclear transport factor 2 family protein [Pedobacter nototheniae]
MSKNKEIVNRYMEGFNTNDHSKILSCLTNDIIWELPGVYLRTGKEAFDREIENEHFISPPEIAISRLIEENNIVIAEGGVKTKRKDGEVINLVFCDVFEMENELIRKLTSYLMNKPT